MITTHPYPHPSAQGAMNYDDRERSSEKESETERKESIPGDVDLL